MYIFQSCSRTQRQCVDHWDIETIIIWDAIQPTNVIHGNFKYKYITDNFNTQARKLLFNLLVDKDVAPYGFETCVADASAALPNCSGLQSAG